MSNVSVKTTVRVTKGKGRSFAEEIEIVQEISHCMDRSVNQHANEKKKVTVVLKWWQAFSKN